MGAVIINLIVDAVNPKPLPAIDFLRRIVEAGVPQDVDALLELAPEFERALEDAQRMQREGQGISRRCQQLKPMPSSQQVVGF